MSASGIDAAQTPAAPDQTGPAPDRVVIPTTDGPIEICKLERLTRIPVSTMQLHGDFRQLRIAPDYHAFVTGPLTLHGISDGAWRLELDDEIDTGRSWELPVLVAHLLKEAPPRGRLIWATGAVDGDLCPAAGNYHLDRKIEVNRSLFESARAEEREIVAILPPSEDPAELPRIRAALEELGATVHAPRDLDALRAALNAGPAKTVRLPALRRSLPWKPLLSIMGAAALITGATLYALSTRTIETTLPSLAIEGLYSEGDFTCQDLIWAQTGGRRIAATLTGDTYHLSNEAPLCGVNVTNRTGSDVDLGIGSGLATMLMFANPVPDILKPGATARLIFSAEPGSLREVIMANGTDYRLVLD